MKMLKQLQQSVIYQCLPAKLDLEPQQSAEMQKSTADYEVILLWVAVWSDLMQEPAL